MGETRVKKSRRLHTEIYFLTFWTIKSQSQGIERIVITTYNPQKRKPFDCNYGGRNEACTCGQRWLWMPRKKSIFWNFRTIKVLMREKINDLISQSIFTSSKLSAETKMEDTKPLVTGKRSFIIQYRYEILWIALFGISDCQYSNARNKINNFSIENVLRNKKLLTENLIEEMKPIVMFDKWGWVLLSRKKFESFFWKLRTIGILMQRTKATVFRLNAPLQVLCFRLNSWWRNSKL